MSDVPPIYRPAGQITVLNASSDGVLGRRVVAYLLDLLFIALFAGVLSLIIGVLAFLSFGLLAHLFVLVPATGVIYATLLIGGGHGATWGMRIMGLGYRRYDDGGLPSLAQGLAVTLMFYLSIALTALLLVLLVPLFTHRHRTLHDILAGLVMVRTDTL
jgi:uncharacterized RDD family membrane protein YckC